MIVGVAGKTEELSINPLQLLSGKSMKASIFGGMASPLKQLSPTNILPFLVKA